jgi:alcohol dehydrogenase (NADP+)
VLIFIAYPVRGINETLTGLGLAYVDLYLMHWPISFRKDFAPSKGDNATAADFVDVPLLETW